MPGLKELFDRAFRLNQFSPQSYVESQLGSLLVKERVHVIKAMYDFAIQGGALGDHNFVDEDGKDIVLPAGALITRVLIDPIIQPTSGGAASIPLSSGEAAVDISEGDDIATYTGVLGTLVNGTPATVIKLTQDRTPYLTVLSNALTAGKFNLMFELLIGDESQLVP